MSRARRAGLAASLIIVFSAWIAIPTTGAGFLALDHPGWSRTDHGWTFGAFVAALLVAVGFLWRPVIERRRRIAPTRVL